MLTKTESDFATSVAEHDDKDLLKFITCGSVDDGKSTLIGRLLLELGAIYDDQIESLKNESAKQGSAGDQVDPALLLDGLEDERQQGITIDVAYRYFTTASRKFIIADTPGHEQYTRNMATGASTVDLAVILVDATRGISTQTKRHATIVSLLGIKQIVLAVNKIDLRDFEQQAFEGIRADFAQLVDHLSFDRVTAIPLSALDGDNVATNSDRMPWYEGPSLLECLHQATVENREQEGPLRFPVQWVNRPDSGFRGFSGTIASGSLAVDSPIRVLPSGKTSRVERIVTMDGDQQFAKAGDSITLTLADEIDIARGDMLVGCEDEPSVSRNVEAKLIWMSGDPLIPNRHYWLKHTTRKTSCEVKSVAHRIDVNSQRAVSAATLAQNDIGHCQIELHDPIVFDSYQQNRQTGSFILVDRVNHETVAAGMLMQPSAEPTSDGHWDQQATLIRPTPVVSMISAEQRRTRYRQNPLTILITGLSRSGKTTVAVELEKQLFDSGCAAVMLDGQTMRQGISRDLGFSADERSENLRRAAEIAKIINDAGQICVAAFVAPSGWTRAKAKQLIGADRFLHIHLSTPVEVCRQRDITGQYMAADQGAIANFPGVTFPYEEPTDADMLFDTAELTATEIASRIIHGFHVRLGLER